MGGPCYAHVRGGGGDGRTMLCTCEGWGGKVGPCYAHVRGGEGKVGPCYAHVRGGGGDGRTMLCTCEGWGGDRRSGWCSACGPSLVSLSSDSS